MGMMRMKQLDNTTDRIREWVMGNFPLAKQQNVGLHDSLLESGIIDSLGTLEVVMFLETEFGVEITDEEMVADHFESIASISGFVESKFRIDQGCTGSG